MVELPFGGESEGLPPPPNEEPGHAWANFSVYALDHSKDYGINVPIDSVATNYECTCSFTLTVIGEQHHAHDELKFKCPNRHFFKKFKHVVVNDKNFAKILEGGEITLEEGSSYVVEGDTYTVSTI